MRHLIAGIFTLSVFLSSYNLLMAVMAYGIVYAIIRWPLPIFIGTVLALSFD